MPGGVGSPPASQMRFQMQHTRTSILCISYSRTQGAFVCNSDPYPPYLRTQVLKRLLLVGIGTQFFQQAVGVEAVVYAPLRSPSRHGANLIPAVAGYRPRLVSSLVPTFGTRTAAKMLPQWNSVQSLIHARRGGACRTRCLQRLSKTFKDFQRRAKSRFKQKH